MDGLLDDDHPQYLRDSDVNMYTNTIADMTPGVAYTEVCFKAGSVLTDIHAVSGPTTGGNCVPGDPGWIIEKNARAGDEWVTCRMTCLKLGMRLPEVFEFQFSCMNSSAFGLVINPAVDEWASNYPVPMYMGAVTGMGVAILGGSTCHHGGYVPIVRSDSGFDGTSYRCVR